MSGLPQLPEHSLRRIGREEPVILRDVRFRLAARGEGRRTLLGADPEHLNDWIRIYARQLMRLYAVPYLQIDDVTRIAPALIERLLVRVCRDWFRGVKSDKTEILRAVAESAMRDEFEKCSEESLGSRAQIRPTSIEPAAIEISNNGVRTKPGPKPRTERYAQVLRILQQVFGERWKNWRAADLNDLAEALDAEQVPVPTPWRRREPKRKTWVDGLDTDKGTFKKAVSYSIQQGLKTVGPATTITPPKDEF